MEVSEWPALLSQVAEVCTIHLVLQFFCCSPLNNYPHGSGSDQKDSIWFSPDSQLERQVILTLRNGVEWFPEVLLASSSVLEHIFLSLFSAKRESSRQFRKAKREPFERSHYFLEVQIQYGNQIMKWDKCIPTHAINTPLTVWSQAACSNFPPDVNHIIS